MAIIQIQSIGLKLKLMPEHPGIKGEARFFKENQISSRAGVLQRGKFLSNIARV
jgi:hypothetical protein